MADQKAIVTYEILQYFYQKLKQKFVQNEEGKVLSSNDYTDGEKNFLQNIIEHDGDEYVTEKDVDDIYSDTEDTGVGEGSVSGDGTSLDDL
jgi:hypothetical protein